MKRKELEALAAKIAKQERIIQTSDDAKEKKQAEIEVMKLSRSVNNLEDMVKIDEIVMEMLEKNLKKS